jgi:hypothetical protein
MRKRAWTRRLPALILVVAAIGPAGCFDLTGRPRELTGSGMDMFAPVSMRIHPLTRLLPVGGARPAATAASRAEQIEIHVEFKDQFGDVGKAVGVLELEVEDTQLNFLGGDHRVAAWQEDIRTPRENAKYWDAITRSYVFTHDPANPAALRPGSKFNVQVTMTFPNGTKLHDKATVTVRKGE